MLRQPVLFRGIRIGRPTDVVLDLDGLRVVGLVLRCGDDVDRFLPYAVAWMEEGAIHLESPLQLVEDRDFAFYRRRAASLRSLLGQPVESRGSVLGTLSDVVVGPGGAITALVVAWAGEKREVPAGPGLSIGGRRVASAA